MEEEDHPPYNKYLEIEGLNGMAAGLKRMELLERPLTCMSVATSHM